MIEASERVEYRVDRWGWDDLETRLNELAFAGWRVITCHPVLVHGPGSWALVVMERAQP